MSRKLLWGIIGLVIVFPVIGALAGIKVLQIRTLIASGAEQTIPVTVVNAAEVRQEEWQPRVSAVGSAVAVQGTTVSTEADGMVREILFKPGSTVKAGDVLVQLDVEVEQAQLRSAEAAAELARSNAARARELFQSRTISQAELDAAEASVKEANAQLDNIRALIAKKTVRAPFDGRLGIREISIGQYLNRGSPVVSLQSLDPIFVEFSLPQQRLADVAEGLTIAVTTDAFAPQSFEGVITAINSDVDPVTRSVRVQATLDNKDGRLRPGMFVSADVVLDRSEQVLVIPATAVLHAPFGDRVYVIEEGEAGPDGKKPLVARQRVVRLGARRGDFVVVTEGLKTGEQVVSTAPFKLQPDMPVVIDNTVAPEFKLEPTVRNT